MSTFSKSIKALAVALLVAAPVAQSQVRLGANCLMNSVGYGMYSMDASSNINFTKMAETIPLFGGAVYVNGKYYGTYYDYDYVSGVPTLTEVSWYTYDPVTWQVENRVDCPLDYTYIATDRTYDPSTGTVYSLVYDRTAAALWLATTNLQTGASTMIAPVDNDVFTIASDARGNLYGINTSAKLFSISAVDGSTTLIGSTDIMPDWACDYQQSITFDYETGRLYWAEFHAVSIFDSVAALYEVNTLTAKATKIADIPGNPELTGLYVIPNLPAGSPAVASELNAHTASVGSTSVRFSFRAPQFSVDGKQLDASETISFEVTVDNDLVDIAELLPGQLYTSDYMNVSRGYHTLKVTGTNAAGQGETAALNFYSGYDVPSAPRNVTLSSDVFTATIAWEAPLADGAQGGPVRSPLTYNVTRYPGEVTVASGLTALTVTDTPADPALYYYVVTAVSPDGEGAPGRSNSVVIAHYDTPYACGFDSEDDFNLFTIYDITSNGKVWNYDEDRACLRHPWSLYDPIDDYIVSPAIILDSSKSYRVSFDAWQMVEGYDEHIMLYYGTSPDPSSMTFVLDTERLRESSTNYAATVAALKDGPHYFALRSKTGTNGFMSYADNLRVVEDGLASVPEGVGNLSVSAADGGALAVTVEFDAPSLTLQGLPLASLSSIDIIRGEGSEPIKSFDSPKPGEHLSWTDSSVKTGTYTYRVIASNASGSGDARSATVFAGVDVPMPVENVAFLHDDGGSTISWDAPSQGVNGGNLNGLLSYEITRYVNSQAQIVESDLTDTEYTDTWVTTTQAYVYYTVTAKTSAGASDPVATDGYSAGAAYTLPFIESFAGGTPENNPWSVEQVAGLQGSWTIQAMDDWCYIRPYDSDGGLATFDGYHSYTNNCELRLVSPVISFNDMKDITMRYHIYHFTGYDSWSGEADPAPETYFVEVSVNNGPFEKVPGSDGALQASKSGWQQHELSLDAYKGATNVRVAFRAKSAGGKNINLDAIAIDGTSSVGFIADDACDAEPIYYNLSGVRVDNPASGVYIVVRGATATKEVVK